MPFHPDDVVIVFTKDDVRTILPENSKLSLDDACKVIARQFDSSPVFEQMGEIIKLAEQDDEDNPNLKWEESEADEEDKANYGPNVRVFHLYDYSQPDPQIIDTRFENTEK